MVRLKEAQQRIIDEAVADFNSTMVRLKGQELCDSSFYEVNFNSTMVRLKVCNFILPRQCKYNFNSTMVRLKEYTEDDLTEVYVISIPRWFD